jgi:hypothetical protein
MKWKLKNLPAVNEFLDYFNTEWLKNNPGWYEEIAQKTPLQDNGLESNNNVIKSHHSLRRRLPLGHYLSNAEKMLNQWSVDRTKHKMFQDTFEISKDDWKMAYTWIKENGRILIKNTKVSMTT